jgi:mannose-6-phosphate isomerase-like protein (cupin superfamily)
MKRRSFLQSAITVPFAAVPFIAKPVPTDKKRVGKGFKVEKGKDRFDASITLLEGDTFFTKISSKDTDGDTFLFESTRIVKGGPPLHYHPEQDEWFYILEGEFLFKIGEETFTAKAGDSLFGPRMIPHAFSKTSEGTAKMMIMFQPAGKMEMHFKAVSEGLYKGLNEEEKRKMQADHGVVVVGAALGHEK